MRADSARTGSVRTESAGTDSDTCLPVRARERTAHTPADRKSTRLNSSHDQISYAVFCLKKKNTKPLSDLQRRSQRGATKATTEDTPIQPDRAPGVRGVAPIHDHHVNVALASERATGLHN